MTDKQEVQADFLFRDTTPGIVRFFRWLRSPSNMVMFLMSHIGIGMVYPVLFDLLLISEPRSWREPHGVEALYDIARFHPLPLSPRAQASCDLVVQVVDHYGRVLRGEPYIVRTDQELREGTSDEQGMVIEHNLRGAQARLECGEAVIVIDDPYHQTAKRRYQLVPPTDPGDDDDDRLDPDAALPNVDDGDDDDDEQVEDDADGEE